MASSRDSDFDFEAFSPSSKRTAFSSKATESPKDQHKNEHFSDKFAAFHTTHSAKVKEVFFLPEQDTSFIDGLEKLEKDRRNLKNAASLRGLGLLFRWDGTVVRMVLLDTRIYASYALFFFSKFNVEYKGASVMSIIGVVAGMMSFLLVFYASECYRRYMAQYNAQCKARQRLNNFFFYACSAIGEQRKNEEVRMRIQQMFRYACAAHILAYCALSDAYNAGNFCWALIRRYSLLTEEEKTMLEDVMDVDNDTGKGNNYRALLWWIQVSMNQLISKKLADAKEGTMALRHIYAMSDFLSELIDFVDVTIPFSYSNLVFVMTSVYCPLLSLCLGTIPTDNFGMVLQLIIVTFLNVFITGLLILSRALINPFGNDKEDLSVFDQVISTIDSCNAIMKNLNKTPDFQVAVEQFLLPTAFTSLDADTKLTIDTSQPVIEGTAAAAGGGGGGALAEESKKEADTEVQQISNSPSKSLQKVGSGKILPA